MSAAEASVHSEVIDVTDFIFGSVDAAHAQCRQTAEMASLRRDTAQKQEAYSALRIDSAADLEKWSRISMWVEKIASYYITHIVSSCPVCNQITRQIRIDSSGIDDLLDKLIVLVNSEGIADNEIGDEEAERLMEADTYKRMMSEAGTINEDVNEAASWNFNFIDENHTNLCGIELVRLTVWLEKDAEGKCNGIVDLTKSCFVCNEVLETIRLTIPQFISVSIALLQFLQKKKPIESAEGENGFKQ